MKGMWPRQQAVVESKFRQLSKLYIACLPVGGYIGVRVEEPDSMKRGGCHGSARRCCAFVLAHRPSGIRWSGMET